MRLALQALSGLLALFLFFVAPFLGAPDPLASALASILLLSALATTTLGELRPSGVIAAAVSAFALAALEPVSPAFASGAALALVMLPRAGRARSHGGRVLIAALAFTGGICGAWLVARAGAADGGTTTLIYAAGATVLVAAPLLVTVDDPQAYRLRRLLPHATGTLRWEVLRALVLRRRGLPPETRSEARRRVERAWRALLVALEARVARSASADLVARSRAYLKDLQQAEAAARRSRALRDELDDTILEGLRLERDDLLVEAQALAEVQSAVRASRRGQEAPRELLGAVCEEENLEE